MLYPYLNITPRLNGGSYFILCVSAFIIKIYERSSKINIDALRMLVIFLVSSNALAKDVDVQLFLNQKLTSKPSVKLSRNVPITTKSCKTIYPHNSGSGRGRRPGEGDPEDRMPVTVCTDTNTNSVQQYEDSASVITTKILKVNNLVFNKSQMVTLPERGIFDYADYQNCDDVSLSQTVSLSVSGNKGFSVTKTESLTTSKSGSISLNASFTGGSASTTLSISESIGLSSQTNESSSDTVTRTSSTTVSIPPKRSGRFELLVYETTIEIPYSASVVVDGDLAPNESGLTMASQLLSEDERTLPFSGVLRITNVSNANIRTIPAPKPYQCKDTEKDLTLTTHPFVTIPSKAIQKATKKAFTSEKALFSKIKPSVRNSFTIDSLAAPQIGPADGIGYEIISISDVAKAEPSCGFNDLGIMNLGLFSIETRRYTQYANGSLVAFWVDKIETFKSCWPL